MAKRAGSEGWIEIGSPGTASQRRAPLASMPTKGVATRASSVTTYRGRATRSQKRSGRRATPATHQSATATPVQWRTARGGSASPMLSAAVVL